MLVIIALVLFVAGDLTSIFNPLFQSFNSLISPSGKKTKPVRTGPDDAVNEDTVEAKDAMNLIGKYH